MLPHDVGVAGGGLEVGGAIRRDKVFRWHIYRGGTTKGRIEVDLLECRACEGKSKQHTLMLIPVLGHPLGHHVVQVFFDPLCLTLTLRR